MRTKGYVLKVAVASASIGCATLACGKDQAPVGTVAMPPGPIGSAASPPDPAATPTPTPTDPPVAVPGPIGSAAPAPDVSVDAGAKPRGVHKVPRPTQPTVGTTAHAPDAKP